MDKQQRQELLILSWSMQDKVEQAILHHAAAANDTTYSDKQRLLLSDMALQLLQTALKPGRLESEDLISNLNDILLLSNEFIPHVDLSTMSNSLKVPYKNRGNGQ
jgi:hypothetical protein